MKAWTCFIYTVLFFIITLSLVLISSPAMTKPIIIIMGCMWLYGLIKCIISDGETGDVDGSEQAERFGENDFIACKIGEWLTKK